MKTHPSSRNWNIHCHDMKKNLAEISVFICASSASTRATKRKTCAFPGLDLGYVTHFTGGLKGRGLLYRAMLCRFHVRDNLCGGVFKGIILMHYAKAINITGGSLKTYMQERK